MKRFRWYFGHFLNRRGDFFQKLADYFHGKAARHYRRIHLYLPGVKVAEWIESRFEDIDESKMSRRKLVRLIREYAELLEADKQEMIKASNSGTIDYAKGQAYGIAAVQEDFHRSFEQICGENPAIEDDNLEDLIK